MTLLESSRLLERMRQQPAIRAAECRCPSRAQSGNVSHPGNPRRWSFHNLCADAGQAQRRDSRRRS